MAYKKTQLVEVKSNPSTNKIKVSTKAPKKKRELPGLTLDSAQLKEIADWQIGGEYYVVMKIKQKSMRYVDKWEKEQYGYDEHTVKADFEVKGVKDYSEDYISHMKKKNKK